MFWNAFVGLDILLNKLKPFDIVLVGFSSEHVQLMGYVELKTTFGERDIPQTLLIKYMVVRALSSYNFLLG